jgi:biopolymer transport protein ExbD
MRPRFRSASLDVGGSLTPLVDVVLVVLVFLMLAGTFAAGTHYMLAPTPRQIGGTGPALTVAPEPLLEVFVDPAGDGFVARVGAQQARDRAALTAVLDDQRRALAAEGFADVRVSISPRGSAKYRDVMTAFDAANEAGFSRVAFASSR